MTDEQAEMRWLRQAIRDAEQRLLRAQRAQSLRTPRLVGQVFNGGAMPSSGDHFFSLRETVVTGTESEGAAPVLTVDSAKTFLCDVIGSHIPSVGDYLIARRVAHRWVTSQGAAPPVLTCPACFVVTACSRAQPNCTVQLTLGGSVVASGTTDANGKVCLNIPTSGVSYGYTVTPPSGSGFAVATGSLVLSCSATIFHPVSLGTDPSYTALCCNSSGTGLPCPNPLPRTLYADDGQGVVTLTFTGGSWSGCALRTASQTINAACTALVGSASVPIVFTLTCLDQISQYRMQLQIQGPGCHLPGAVGQDYPNQGFNCSSIPNFNIGNSDIFYPATCAPFSASLPFTNDNWGLFFIYGNNWTVNLYQ
jgi:hypothetical protein